MARGCVRAWAAGLMASGGALLALAGSAGAASLPRVEGPRPGPDILYAPPFDAPQLQNAGVWKAPPILVSGASAYRDGEFLYQDFLYDDRGANGGQRDPNDPRSFSAGPSADTFSNSNGTYTYPTAAAYAGNAADFVELRVKPLPDATAFRITLNALVGVEANKPLGPVPQPGGDQAPVVAGLVPGRAVALDAEDLEDLGAGLQELGRAVGRAVVERHDPVHLRNDVVEPLGQVRHLVPHREQRQHPHPWTARQVGAA